METLGMLQSCELMQVLFPNATRVGFMLPVSIEKISDMIVCVVCLS